MDVDVKFKRIQCLDRALDVVSLISRSSGMTMNEIAAGIGLKTATAYNLVKTLSSRGFLANHAGRYSIGASLGLVASQWNIRSSLPQLVQPLLREISEKTGDESSLAILCDGRPEIISQEQGSTGSEFTRYSHTTWDYPLYLATGRTLVAFNEESLWDEYIRQQMERGPIAEAEKEWGYREWVEMLQMVRASGYALISPRLPVHGGKQSLGLPLFNPAGSIIAAIGITCELENCNEEHLNMARSIGLQTIQGHSLF